MVRTSASELGVADRLRRVGETVWLPQYGVVTSHARTHSVKPKLALPGLLFVRASLTGLPRVLTTPGVRRVITHAGTVQPIEVYRSDLMGFAITLQHLTMKAAREAEHRCKRRGTSHYKVGDKVTVVPLGVSGLVVEVRGSQVVVSVGKAKAQISADSVTPKGIANDG